MFVELANAIISQLANAFSQIKFRLIGVSKQIKHLNSNQYYGALHLFDCTQSVR